MQKRKYLKLTFKEKVLKVVAMIPKGQTMTYKEVAELSGSPGAFRAVGSIMKHNYNRKIPCHRVVHSSGKLGEYNRGGESKKRSLLRKEGVI